MLNRSHRFGFNQNIGTLRHRNLQLKRTEEAINRLHMIIEQSPEIIIITDVSGVINYVNPQFSNVTGYSMMDVIGRRPSLLKSGNTPVSVYKDLWETIKSGKTWRGEFQNRKKDGEFFWVRVTISPVRGYANEITDFVALEEDFTESKKMQDALLREKSRVEQLSRAKDEFMRTITHELKTPLSVILGNMSMLRGMPPKSGDGEWGKILDMIDRNTLRLRRSIEQILQLSRLDSLVIKREGVDLLPILRDIYSEYLPLAQMKGLRLRMSLPKGRVLVVGDSELLRLALANFVGNAVKFTEKGGVSVSVEVVPKAAVIRVSDTGIGISQKDMHRLFQKFFKANADAPGSGVGLALSEGIINKHRGKISVKSELGAGTTFEITLLRGVAHEKNHDNRGRARRR